MKRFARFLRLFRAGAVLFLLVGCAGYSSKIQRPRGLYEAGQFETAAAELEALSQVSDNDQLLYLMDLGMVYHAAGKYSESVKKFAQAEKLAASKDFTSVTQEVGAVITNDDALFYKGEDFEKILLNVYQAIDYALAAQWEDALVECRRLNRKLDMQRDATGGLSKFNFFAKYLAAVLFESQGDWNSAFVDYRLLHKWAPGTPYLGAPLLRAADRLQATQELERYRKAYPEEQNYRLGKHSGEIVLLLEQGKGPVKVPSAQHHLVPVFSRRSYRSRSAVLRVASAPQLSATSYPLFSIEQTAIDELNEKLPGIIAKKIAGVAAKQAVGAGVSKATENKFLGFLTSLFLHATDKADLRSWTTLPATLQIARLTVPAGRLDIELDMVGSSGEKAPQVARWPGFEIKPGKVHLLSYRMPD